MLTACWTCSHGLFLLQVGLSTPDGDTYLVVPPAAAAASTNTLSDSSPMAASIARRGHWYPRRFIAPPFLLRSVIARGSRSLLPARRGTGAAAASSCESGIPWGLPGVTPNLRGRVRRRRGPGR